jgi:hypothetical protein
MERVSGENFYEYVRASNAPVGRPAHPPSQFEFGAEDSHNWEGEATSGLNWRS